MQRLFSTFPDGWPGAGLLLLRVLTGLALIWFGFQSVREAAPVVSAAELTGIACGVFLLLGLFTPVAGAIAAMAKILIMLSSLPSGSNDVRMELFQGVLGAVLAMTGPGAWSIDAKRFGRRHIDFRDR